MANKSIQAEFVIEDYKLVFGSVKSECPSIFEANKFLNPDMLEKLEESVVAEFRKYLMAGLYTPSLKPGNIVVSISIHEQ